MLNFEHDEALREREVHLFPTVRISSTREAELRATAALLSMVRAVSEFGRAVVRMSDGPAGHISCYTEVTLKEESAEGVKENRLDGIIRVVRGKTEWSALLEVKVGDNRLRQDQFDAYHRLAKDRGFNAVITVSNQAAQTDGLPPLAVDGRRLRGVPVYHISWDRLLSEARMLSARKGVDDPDQQWMLDEWIRYVANPESKIIEPPSLGEHWGTVLQAAREANIASFPRQVEAVVGKWDAYLKKVALRLRATLGVEVRPRLRRADKKDPAGRQKRLIDRVLCESRLSGVLRIPDAIGDIDIDINLQAQTVRYGVEFDAPNEGRQLTRIKWLVRQLDGITASESMLIRVQWDQRRLESSAKLGDAVRDPTRLLRCGLESAPPSAFPKKYVLEWTRSLPRGRGKSNAQVLEGVSGRLEEFYGSVVQHLVGYQRKAPKLDKAEENLTRPESREEDAAPIESAANEGRCDLAGMARSEKERIVRNPVRDFVDGPR